MNPAELSRGMDSLFVTLSCSC